VGGGSDIHGDTSLSRYLKRRECSTQLEGSLEWPPLQHGNRPVTSYKGAWIGDDDAVNQHKASDDRLSWVKKLRVFAPKSCDERDKSQISR
jgi:hypothetical protein